MKKSDKAPKIKTTDSERETRVLLEAISQQVQTVAEGHGTIIKKLEDHDKRLDSIESELTGVKTELDGVKTELDGVKTELTGVKTDLEVVKTVVMDTNQRVKIIEKKIDNHETRITKLEEKMVV